MSVGIKCTITCRLITLRQRFARAAPAPGAKRFKIQKIVDVRRPSNDYKYNSYRAYSFFARVVSQHLLLHLTMGAYARCAREGLWSELLSFCSLEQNVISNGGRVSPALAKRTCLAPAQSARRGAAAAPIFNDILLNVKMGRNVRQARTG